MKTRQKSVGDSARRDDVRHRMKNTVDDPYSTEPGQDRQSPIEKEISMDTSLEYMVPFRRFRALTDALRDQDLERWKGMAGEYTPIERAEADARMLVWQLVRMAQVQAVSGIEVAAEDREWLLRAMEELRRPTFAARVEEGARQTG